MKRFIFFWLRLWVLLWVVVGAHAADISSEEYKPGEFVVKFYDAISTQDFFKQLWFENHGLQVEEELSSTLKLFKVRVIQKTKLEKFQVSRKQQAEFLKLLKSNPGIEVVEPNYIYKISAPKKPVQLPNDPNFPKLWGLWNLGIAGLKGADIKAPQAWAVNTGSKKVIVAVVDTGVDYNHADLKANMWIKPGTESKPVYGLDAITGVEDPMDDHGHGTHCAGTIGAVGDNHLGVVGVNWAVSIMAIRFMDKTGSGDLAGAIKGLEYALENGAQVLSNSWGGGAYSETLARVIELAKEKGVLFIAASGNDSSSNDQSPSFPASYNIDNVISVGATTNSDRLADFSNFGAQSVHIAAPGLNIMSTTPKDTYSVFSGTSMAAPHVSGAVALLLAQEEGLGYSEQKKRLLESADKIDRLRLKIKNGARLNLYNLLSKTVVPGPVLPGENDWVATVPFKVSTPHPYPANHVQRWELKHKGAEFIRIKFNKFELEKTYDTVSVFDLATGEVIDVWHGDRAPNSWSPELKTAGIALEFKSDSTVQKYGFDIESYQWSALTE